MAKTSATALSSNNCSFNRNVARVLNSSLISDQASPKTFKEKKKRKEKKRKEKKRKEKKRKEKKRKQKKRKEKKRKEKTVEDWRNTNGGRG